MPALGYCILRGTFSEMFDSLARITGFGALRTRARTVSRTHGIKVSELYSFGKEVWEFLLRRHTIQQQQSVRIIGTFRFGAMGGYNRKDIPIFGVRLFETISGYIPYPAIQPHYFGTLHFVEHRLWRRQYFVKCLYTTVHRKITLGPPIPEY